MRPPRLPNPPLLSTGPFEHATRTLAPGDIAATAEQREAYLRYTHLGDPAADEVVAMFARLPTGQGRALFERALEEGIEALPEPPPELTALFEQVRMPYWVDTDRLDHACRVIARTGPLAYTSLSMLALLGGYLASRVTKTLTSTGTLQRMAPRRLAETGIWFSEVTAAGGLERFAPGWKNTLRVRIRHATVRAGLSRRPDWEFEEWDHPINQSQQCGTVLIFAMAFITGSQAGGIHFSHNERDAVYHMWRYIGFLLGTDPVLLFTDEHDAWRLFWLQADYEFRRPDHDSRNLAAALIAAIGPLLVGDGRDLASRVGRSTVTEFMSAYARLVLGKDNADFLGLSDRKLFQHITVGAAKAVAALEYPRRVVPGATGCAERLGRRASLALTHRMATRQAPTSPRVLGGASDPFSSNIGKDKETPRCARNVSP